MSSRPSPTFRQQIADRVAAKTKEYAALLAERIGPAPGTVQETQEQQARAWMMRTPGLDPQALLAEGRPAAEVVAAVWPERLRLIGRGRPSEQVKRAEAFARLAQRYLEDREPELLSEQAQVVN